MTEDEGRDWIAARFGVAAVERIEHLLALVVAENSHQNLIAPSTVDAIWVRHAVDSAQLVGLASGDGLWLDVGTGGGFPGLVVALLRLGPVCLVEPRKRRAEFLSRCVVQLGLADRVSVVPSKVEAVHVKAAVISARAVGSIENLLLAAASCANANTRWLLPRGRSGSDVLITLRRDWTGMFHVEQSVTDAESSILVLDQVRRR